MAWHRSRRGHGGGGAISRREPLQPLRRGDDRFLAVTPDAHSTVGHRVIRALFTTFPRYIRTPLHRYIVPSSHRHTVTPSLRHTVTPSHCHTVTPSHRHTVTPYANVPCRVRFRRGARSSL